MATPFKFGTEFLVNTNTGSGQFEPAIIGLADGRFVAAWSSMSGDGSGSAIRAQVFDCDGSAVGAEFVVNSATANFQYQPAITTSPKGGFVVTWADGSATSGDTSGFAVRAQMFNNDGSISGTEFVVNTTTAAGQSRPTITALSAFTAAAPGLFVVAWTDDSASGGDTSGSAIRAQLFNANGTMFGAEFLVNTTTASSQSSPTVTALAAGRFVVAWEDGSATGSAMGGDTSGFSIRAQIFNANGSTSGAEFVVNTTTANDQYQPTITALVGGGFVVVWGDSSSTGGDTFAHAVRAQIFDASGVISGPEFLVNTTTTSGQNQPTVTAFPDGRFVVVWTDQSQSGSDTSFAAIRGQLFDASGAISGAEFLVNTTTANGQIDPTVTTLADGRFVVAWEDNSQIGGDASGTGIRAQIFDPREAAVVLLGTVFDDCLIGTAFNDQISGGFGNDHLTGAAGQDMLSGGDGTDRLFGGSGIDTVIGGNGNDQLFGGSSLDYIYGQAGKDKLYGGATADWLYGGAHHDRLFAQAGNDQVLGEAGNDQLFGGQGNDWLFGGADNDLLSASIGNDRLTGGAGVDQMAGGAGADVFVFSTAAEAGTIAVHDKISDFTAGSDRIDLSAIQFGQVFIGAAVFTNTAGQVRYDVATGLLAGDLNGDGVSDYAIELTNLAAITGVDLIV